MSVQCWGFAIHTKDGVVGCIPQGCTDILSYQSFNPNLTLAYTDKNKPWIDCRYAKKVDESCESTESMVDRVKHNKYKVDIIARDIAESLKDSGQLILGGSA